jgi:hypothetical protein
MADAADFNFDVSDSAVPGANEPQNTGVVVPTSSTAPILSPTSQQTFGQAITYGLPGLGIGLLDTLGQSLGVLKNDTIPNALRNFTGDGEGSLGDFYTRHQAALRGGGEVIGMLLPGLAAMKALKTVNGLREAGSLGAALKNSTALDVLLGNSAELSTAEIGVKSAVNAAASDWGITAGRTLSVPAVTQAKKAYTAARLVDNVRTSVAFELGTYSAFNSSQLFYPPDTTTMDQLKWAGLGLAGGAGLELAMSRYAVRTMVQAAAKASATENIFSVSTAAKDIDKTIFRPNNRGVGVTLYATTSNDLKNLSKTGANSSVLQSNIAQDQVNIKKVLSEQIGQMAYDTDPSGILKRTSINQDQIELGIKALDKNPTALAFAEKIDDLPEMPHHEFFADIAKKLDAAKSTREVELFAASALPEDKQLSAIKAAHDKYNQIEDAANRAYYVLEPNGDTTVFRNRAPNWLDTNSFSSIKRKSYTTPDPTGPAGAVTKNTKLLVRGTNDIILHDNFRLEIPKGATSLDYSASYAAGSKLIAEWKPVEGQTFVLTPKVNWRTLEMTSALANVKQEAQSAIKLGEGFSSIDDVNFHVLNEKFKEFQKLMPSTERAPISKKASLLGRTQSTTSNLTPAEVIDRLNLPRPDGFEPSPVVEMFAHAKLQGMKDLNEMFPKPKGEGLYDAPYTQLDLVKQHLRETAGVSDNAIEIPYQGNLLEQATSGVTDKGTVIDVPKPLFVGARSIPMGNRVDFEINARVQAMRDVQLERLAKIDPEQAPLVTGVIGKIVNASERGSDLSGAADKARAVQLLHDGTLSGTAQVVYQDRINEQFPTLKAAHLLAQDGDKWVDNYVATLAANNLTPRYATILSPKNRNDLLDFNRIEQAYRHGWEIKGVSNGTFILDPDSKINKLLIKEHFPDVDPEEITHLPDMSVTAKKLGYRPLQVSSSASDLALAISDMSIQSGKENNALRMALGKSPIQLRDFHLPTPELNKEGTWFVRNPTGRVIATYTGPNFRENEQRALKAAETLGIGHTAVPLKTVKLDHQINDDTFFDLIDYSDQLAKTGAPIKGGLAHTEIDTGPVTLQAMIKSLQEQFLSVGIRSRTAIFEPELNYARQASQTAAESSKENLGKYNIFDRYIATMFSQAPRSTVLGQKGAIESAYQGFESALDKTLTFLSTHFSDITKTESNSKAAVAVRQILRKQTSEEEFRQFQKTLPEWSPFKETQDWAESTFREKSRLTSRQLAGDLSRISATLSLRFLDFGTAINNFAGLMTNAPSVVTALRRLPGESYDQWISRTGAYGSELKDGVVTFSPQKAMITAIKALWKGELNGPMQEAARHGYFEPEYASLMKVLSTPEKPSHKAFDNFVRRASYAADRTEIISRQIAWGMGYKIGKDLHGFTDEKNAYIFANNFVNEMIGNYSPNNKPAMFQGALGLPLGAFQTYMFNFYRRLYGYIERGDKAAVLAQYAAQASLFGARSVPGFSAWNSHFQTNHLQDDDFTTRASKTFGPLASELLLNGTLSNIPKVFGSHDGLAFYTRGSVDITQPVPTLLDISRAPPIQFLANVGGGVKATLNNIFSGAGYSQQQEEEILAKFSTNRALRSIMELAADAKTTRTGQVVDMGTRDAIHVAAALFGTQPSSVRGQQEALRRQTNAELHQQDLRAALTDHTRAIFRSGHISVDELQGTVQDYLKSGGNPQYLGQWFRNTFATAVTPQTQKKLEELGRSGKFLEFQNMLATIQQNQNPNQKGN